MDTFRVELKKGERVIFSEKVVEESELSSVLVEHIDNEMLFPSAIVDDATVHGMASCWCGVQNVGYKIAKNTPNDRNVRIVFS
jgi:hypothetical protein